ncbi:MAG: hypothetical protein COV66_09165 [Nitrospinae bacterium CG11_big_fil_rev_8_21_14_0_20_45_15]|nr:MAG: hypothetical protein COV66_09165 [Nitrospinae bacterium CG11_big_fil_rev_8_21_14_0_20_45_15]
MNPGYPRDLMVMCQDCRIENVVPDYSPDMFPVCNQCREGLIAPNLNETHDEIFCDDCGMSLLLLKTAEFKEGESACRCQGQHLRILPHSAIPEEAKKAGAFDFEEDSLTEGDDYSWVRSEDLNVNDSDYNEIFDQDLGVE